MEKYYYLHNPREAVKDIFGLAESDLPEIQWRRIEMAWYAKFMMDTSGRSTAKTYTLHGFLHTTKNILLPDRRFNVFGINQNMGKRALEQTTGHLIQKYPHILQYFKRSTNSQNQKYYLRGKLHIYPFKMEV